jgi:hypothetical protein
MERPGDAVSHYLASSRCYTLLARSHTIDRIDRLLPWNFTPTPSPAEAG